MVVQLTGLQSSTDTTSYINSSTGVTCDVWTTVSTASTANKLLSAKRLTYVTASSGNYVYVAQSTDTASITSTMRGTSICTVSHSGLNAEWRVRWRGENRSEG
jgi:hypothetical protein